MFFKASALVLPWLTQPGMEGHSITHMPSSSRSNVTESFMQVSLAEARVGFKPALGLVEDSLRRGGPDGTEQRVKQQIRRATQQDDGYGQQHDRDLA